jgi:triosephosphate isomerase
LFPDAFNPRSFFVRGVASKPSPRGLKFLLQFSSMTEFKKRAFIGGNWKCNGTIEKVASMIEMLNKAGDFPDSSEVVIACPSIHIMNAQASMRKDIAIASQDVGLNGYGAHTGELSAEMLVDSGVKWTLAGHSERRAGFGIPGETSELVAKKAKKAIDTGMDVIVCIGEKLEDREADKTMSVLKSQLIPVKDILSETDWKNVVVAYEPVWAIGTGKVASPGQAGETHSQIRAWLAQNVSETVAKEVRIVYGGSVSGKNCVELIKQCDIDGFLVGGSSLKPEFSNIVCCTPGNIQSLTGAFQGCQVGTS